MVDLSKIYKTTKRELEKGVIIADKRPYLGMSILGHHCSRYLWLTFRWAYTETYSKRLHRLFQRGHREEEVIISLLNEIGIKCLKTQTEYVTGFGHIKGHSDGVVIGVIEAPKTPHVLECKTANDKSFKKVQSQANLEKSNIIYYCQTQLYMKHEKLPRCLFIMVNKNDDNLYVERVRYNKDTANLFENRGVSIVLSPLPNKVKYPKTYYKCKRCACYKICHEGSSIDMNCRTCNHSEPTKYGGWHCQFNDLDLSLDEQKCGCNNYEKLNIS